MLRQAQHERGRVFDLVAHPYHPPTGVSAVSVDLTPLSGSGFALRYGVAPASTLLLSDHAGDRLDGLWRSTCFEMFVKNAGAAAYREFNFAPAGAWAIYDFTDWRTDMVSRDLPSRPTLVDCRLDDRAGILPGRYELDVIVGPELLPAGPSKMSLSAVIEETDGIRSYWALAHPPGKPDFHHPACFALELPALGIP